MLPVTPFIPAPYPYRCRLPGCGARCSLECAEALDAKIREEGPDTVAAFIAEPVIGASAGAVVPPPQNFGLASETCDRPAVPFIPPQVTTGLGAVRGGAARCPAAISWGTGRAGSRTPPGRAWPRRSRPRR